MITKTKKQLDISFQCSEGLRLGACLFPSLFMFYCVCLSLFLSFFSLSKYSAVPFKAKESGNHWPSSMKVQISRDTLIGADFEGNMYKN